MSETDLFTQFCELGLWPGVGKALTRHLADAKIHSPDQVTVAALSRLPRITQIRAERLFSAWIGAQHSFQVARLLDTAGLPVRWTGRLTDALGDGAAAALMEDPWQLLVLPEVTVSQADGLATRLLPQVSATDPRRGRAVVGLLFRQAARAGHTCTSQHQIVAELVEYGLDETAIAAALDAGSAGVIATEQPDRMLASQLLLTAEQTIAARLGLLTDAATTLANARQVKSAIAGLDEVQSGAVGLLATAGVSLLTGGPGTGKSRTVSAMVRLCQTVGADLALCAPTGRAAKRLEELAGHPASTMHRLLGARRRGPGHHAIFSHDATNPLPADVVVVDEVSMVDVELGAALLGAIRPGAHLVLVGDPAQLASIGPGRMLADILESQRFPVTELRTLYRHDAGGAIATLATAVRDGELTSVTATDHEVVIVPVTSGGQAAHRVVQVVCDSLPRTFGLSGDTVQVVTPIHRGPAGTQALNAALKAALNPGTGRLSGFDIGDRVVATVNHLDADPTGYANGEVGTVTAIEGRELTVAFPAGLAVVRGKDLADLRHGWAITVHRAQGSEWEAVVVVLPADGSGMLSRPLVYTALTRARRQLTIVHGAGAALAYAVRRIGARPRRTLLPKLLAASGSFGKGGELRHDRTDTSGLPVAGNPAAASDQQPTEHHADQRD